MESKDDYVSERYEPMQDSYDSLMLRLDPAPVLSKIRQFLLKQTNYNKATDTYSTPRGIKPMLTEEGVNELMLEIAGRMSIDKALSDLSENDIRGTMRETGECILSFIFFNSERFEIKESDFDRIFYQILHNVNIFLRRAKAGRENELISRQFVQREQISRQSSAQEGSQAPAMSFLPFGGRK